MNDAGNLALLGRVMGGLIVVLVLIGLAARVARRARGHQGTTGLRVIDRIGLSRDANLTVVEVANRVLLLGVTAQGVTMLADLDAAAERDADEEAEPEPEPVARVRARVEPEPGPGPGPVKDRVRPDAEPRSQRRPVPSAVALEEYPDLASALRAAGRTAGSSSPSGPVITSDRSLGPNPAPTAPRTRAEARAEARARASVAAQVAAQVASPAPAASAVAPASSTSTEIDRIPLPRKQSGTTKKRVVHKPTGQASGSVLSPRTWRQGIEALRDLTVRRG